MSPIVLITGASSGFGKAAAEVFAAAGWNCIITARRANLIEALAKELTQQYAVAVLPLAFDVQDKAAVNQSLGNLPDEWKQIDVLVNNAGLALGREPFDVADMDDWDTMIDTNVKGLLYVTRAVLPYMQSRGKGHIINIGSTAGVEVYKDGNAYCASKHAVVKRCVLIYFHQKLKLPLYIREQLKLLFQRYALKGMSKKQQPYMRAIMHCRLKMWPILFFMQPIYPNMYVSMSW